MSRFRAGVTLIELMVTMGVFAMVLVTVLGFYRWGANTTRYQTRKMDAYRRTLDAVDRILSEVAGATVLYVDERQIVFAPHNDTAPLSRVRQHWPAQSVTVCITQQQVVWATPDKRETILILAPTQTLQFKATQPTTLPPFTSSLRPCYESLAIDSEDDSLRFDGPGGPNSVPMTINRAILLRTSY